MKCNGALGVARHLENKGCQIEVEVATTGSGTADFRVTKEDNTFFAHVKRSNLAGQMKRDSNIILSRLAPLKRIARPVTMSVVFYTSPTDSGMQSLYRRIRHIALNGEIGHRNKLRDNSGQLVAECEVSHPHTGTHLRLLQMPPVGRGGDEDRIYRQLYHAYKRFKVGAPNFILLTRIWNDVTGDPREALQNFWLAQKHPDSNLVIWFEFDLKQSSVDFLLIPRHNDAIPPYVSDIFGHKIDRTFLKCTKQSN